MLKHAFAALPIALILIACSSSSDDAAKKSELLAECSDPVECDIPLCYTFKSNPQNKKGVCTAQCKTDAECSGNTCTALPPALVTSGITNVCLASCKHDGDCTNGFVCTLFPEGNVCFARLADELVPCIDDTDCAAKKGKCASVTVSGADRMVCTGDLGAADAFAKECSSADECAGLRCISFQANAQNKKGLCSAKCTTDADCPNGICKDLSGEKTCLKSCTDDASCGNGFACVTDTDTGGGAKVCYVSPS